MTCTEFRNDILLEHAGELPAGRKERLAEHVAGCAECRAWRDGLPGMLANASESLRRGEPDAWVMARIRAAAEERAARHPSVFRRPAGRVLAAAALLLIAVGVYVLRPRAPSHSRVDEVHAMLAVVAGNEALQVEPLAAEDAEALSVGGMERETGQAALRSLARQLLIMEGLAIEEGDILASPVEEPETTDLRWRRSPATVDPLYG